MTLTLTEEKTSAKSKSISSGSAPINVMELKITGIALKINQQINVLRLGLIIGGLSIADLANPHPESRYLIDTNQKKQQAVITSTSASTPLPVLRRPYTTTFLEADETFNLRLTATSDASPGFQEKPVELDMAMGFGQVAICVEPESVKRIGVYVMNVFVLNEEVNSVLVPKAPQPVQLQTGSPSTNSRALTAATSSPTPASSSKTPSARASRISINLAAHFESLKLQLFSGHHPLVEAVMTNLRGEFQLFQAGTVHVFSEMQGLFVKDLTPAGQTYPYVVTTCAGRMIEDVKTNMITTEEEEPQIALVRFFYDTYSTSESDHPGYNEALKASLQGLQFTYLQRLVWEVVLFFTMGPIADLIDLLVDAGTVASSEATLIDGDVALTAANAITTVRDTRRGAIRQT